MIILWHSRFPLLTLIFISVVVSPRPLGNGVHFQTLLSPLLKVPRMVLLSSLLWWQLGTNLPGPGAGEWLSFWRVTSKHFWFWFWFWRVGRQTQWWLRHKAIYFSWLEPEIFLFVAWPTGVQRLALVCSSVPVVLFDTPGISMCRSQHADRTTNYMFWALTEAEGKVRIPWIRFKQPPPPSQVF